jgi:predicted GNAT family N-acyltransferase
MKLIVKGDTEITAKDKASIIDILIICFGRYEDDKRITLYFSPTYKHIFLYDNDRLVSYMRIIIRETKFNNKKLLIGGIGDVCTIPEYRGKGLGTKIVKTGMELLKKVGCDIGLLQTDTRLGAKLYKDSGFVETNKSYTFKDNKGKFHNQWKQAVMLAPLNNPKIFDEIMASNKNLYIGSGDW